MYKGQLNHRTPPHETGPSAKPGKRGGCPSGSGWLVARVPVAWSTITIGPQSDTPHNRPASRSQSFVASANHRWASCGWTCASAAPAATSSASSGRVLKWYRIFIALSPLRSFQTRRTRPRELLDSEFTGDWPFRSSRSLLAMNLPLFSRLLQLPIALGMDLLLTPGEDVLRRDVADCTVQAEVVVMLDVA